MLTTELQSGPIGRRAVECVAEQWRTGLNMGIQGLSKTFSLELLKMISFHSNSNLFLGLAVSVKCVKMALWFLHSIIQIIALKVWRALFGYI